MYNYLPSHNIALLFLYAISLRFILFDYTNVLWEELIKLIDDWILLSTKKTTKKGELIIFNSDVKPNVYLKGLKLILDKLLGCAYCKGCWAGYIVYLLFVIDYSHLVIDIRQVADFAMFSWSCGRISFLVNQKLGI